MDRSLLYFFISLVCVINAIPFQRKCLNSQFECRNGVCINKSYWCKSRYNSFCGDNSENSNCNKYYPHCANDQTFCIINKKCIPLKWACDGYQDCPDKSDEKNCLKDGFRIQDIPGVRKSKEKGRLWLIKQRKANWSWGKDSSRAIITLRLSDDIGFDSTNITTQLMSKQLKLQLSEVLLRNDRKDIKSYEIALYIHSLLAICSNPRNFQGIDLVKLLEDKMDDSKSINPMAALAICNCNQTLSMKQTLKLRKIFFLEKNTPYKIDSEAFALMAFTCLKHISNLYESNLANTVAENDSNWHLDFKATQELTKLQNEDGSFGNVYTTALLIHALLSVDSDMANKVKWNITKSFNYLISQQNEDGSFGDTLATYLILPLMNGKTFIDLGNLTCNFTKPKNVTIQEELDNKNVIKHRVDYYIFVGQEKDVVFSLSLKIPISWSFYDVMRLAAKLDNKFRFKYVDYSWGKYVYSIFGVINNPEEGNYWKLYKVSGNTTFLQEAPDKAFPQAGETYIYWYRPIHD